MANITEGCHTAQTSAGKAVRAKSWQSQRRKPPDRDTQHFPSCVSGSLRSRRRGHCRGGIRMAPGEELRSVSAAAGGAPCSVPEPSRVRGYPGTVPEPSRIRGYPGTVPRRRWLLLPLLILLALGTQEAQGRKKGAPLPPCSPCLNTTRLPVSKDCGTVFLSHHALLHYASLACSNGKM